MIRHYILFPHTEKINIPFLFCKEGYQKLPTDRKTCKMEVKML